MAEPRVTTVTIDDLKFNAMSASVGFSTLTSTAGMPLIGTIQTSIEVVVDIHDTINMPFANLQKVFDLAKIVTRDKIKDIKLEFWQDDHATDVICSFQLKGWISHFQIHSSGGGNHTLMLSLQPTLTQENFPVFEMGN